jgi:hypothetical protein
MQVQSWTMNPKKSDGEESCNDHSQNYAPFVILKQQRNKLEKAIRNLN